MKHWTIATKCKPCFDNNYFLVFLPSNFCAFQFPPTCCYQFNLSKVYLTEHKLILPVKIFVSECTRADRVAHASRVCAASLRWRGSVRRGCPSASPPSSTTVCFEAACLLEYLHPLKGQAVINKKKKKKILCLTASIYNTEFFHGF